LTGDAYGRLARLYDPVTAPFLDPVRRLAREVLLGRGARRVLDACCGTGRLVRWLRAADMAAFGVDASPAMLARARRPRADRPPLARMDVRRLAFADAAFDAAVICFALHENTEADRLAMGRELLRVVRPGGHLLLVDYVVPARPTAMGALVSLAERLAGAEHSGNCRDFLARKGVADFAQRLGRSVAASYPCLGGQAALIVSPA
jgi:demethylmenaquinone methyltransferase/2-methoxy-6-polyprenyl-1,4-benzoquinol methylase